jgi:hypothetical protein
MPTSRPMHTQVGRSFKPVFTCLPADPRVFMRPPLTGWPVQHSGIDFARDELAIP